MTRPRIPLEPLRGFRDILPPDSEEITNLINAFIRIARLHGYREVRTPTLERFELFALKSGEEIRNSMFVFKDKAGREVALRPEVTASIARIYLRSLKAMPKPIRVYYVANCFRYEEPQRARYREFIQAGVELLGEGSIVGDLEVIKLLIKYYDEIGLGNYLTLKLGNTKIYRSLFSKYGLSEEEQDHLLHLMDKGFHDRVLGALKDRGLVELAEALAGLWDQGDNLVKAYEHVATYSEEAARAVSELSELVKMIKEYAPWLKISVDLSFARGLAYYTGVIFEAKILDYPVSVAGGGRYDNLIELYGGEKVPGTGFAIGVDRTYQAVKELGLSLKLRDCDVAHVAIVVLDNSLVPYALKVQDELVRASISSTLFFEERLTKILPRLAREGFSHVVIIGKREVEAQKVVVKDLKSRRQIEVPPSEVAKLVQG